MKKIVITQIFALLFIGAYAQGIYNDGAYIVSTSGSYWVIDNGSFTLTSNSPTIPTQFDNLVITDDASLTLGSASTPAYLTVNDALSTTSPATVTIPSGSTGSSSLIVGTVSGTGSFTVNRYITGASLDWHLISSPVYGQEISGDFTPDGADYDFYYYSEPLNMWVNRKNTNASPTDDPPQFDDPEGNGSLDFVAGRGYLAAYNQANPTKSFSGAINQGTISQSVTFSGTSGYKGANLLGNPYPSSLDWKAADGWTRTMLRNDAEEGTGYSMYIWNETDNNYGAFVSNGSDESGTHNVTRYIPPMQGFFVKAATAGSFQMTEDVCVHESVSSWLKHTHVSPNIIRLKVSGTEHGSDEVVLEDNDVADGGAEKWFSFVETAPSLWINHEDKLYSILLDDVVQDKNHYPIGFKPGIEAQYTINATFDAAQYTDLTLEDKKLNKLHKLLESQTYRFYAHPQDDPNRFVLHFTTVGIDETSPEELIRIWQNGNHIVVQGNQTAERITLTDITGRTLGVWENTENIPTPKTAGVYLVSVESENQRITKKIIIQ